ncbi:MAG: sigma-54-dependent Fis family transcriptional regulator [Paludibacteraceae bacterium]|nr:sigma-54-dependent Fis family transcriptional regulator [Paludibacteraceae bacterium]
MTPQELQTIKNRFGIIGSSPKLDRDIEIAAQVAVTDLSVLITGESGVGKEHFPQIIHAYSPRKHAKYFAVNCGAIPEGTIDSELFGHVKGAYTDARAERKGYFEEANGGTLFLDEVGELPLPTQARLLRVLETGEFIRMGSSEVQKTSVRVVAATNLDMKRAIAEGRFREDLYFRLNAVEIKVPALRERKEDIPLLFRKFTSDFTNKYGMPRIQLTDDATELLKSYYWYGNVRQLKNVSEQICVLEQSREINAETLRKYLPSNEHEQQLTLFGATQTMGGDPYMNERELLYKVLFDMKRDIAELKHQMAAATGGATMPTSSTMMPYGEHREQTQEPEVQEAEVIREMPPIVQEPLTMESAEEAMIRKALERHGGNRKEAAAELGISERTLYRKIKK